VAQTGQVFDVHHRPGNVHDSNGAKAMIGECLSELRAGLGRVQVETRMDSAFFGDEIIQALDSQGVEFTATVPFERFTALKALIEGRQRWRAVNAELAYFETDWKPISWKHRFRFVFIRKRVDRQHKGVLQLDLFEPHEQGYEFKVIVTNKRLSAAAVVSFHEGRGAQEGLFAELKSHCQMDYVPVQTRIGNQLYLCAAMLTHNLSRELQMQARAPQRATSAQRAALWTFQRIDTLRRTLLIRAGRLLRPNGRLVLSINRSTAAKEEMLHYIEALQAA
jgi:hypothetical protein